MPPSMKRCGTPFSHQNHPDRRRIRLGSRLSWRPRGYRLFADILTLRRVIDGAGRSIAPMQYRAAKVLLICRDATLADRHVQDDLDTRLGNVERDGRSPLRDPRCVSKGPEVKGCRRRGGGGLRPRLGRGVGLLLDALRRQKVPRSAATPAIDPNWEVFRRRGAVPLLTRPSA